MLRAILWAYAILFIAFRVHIYFRTANDCAGNTVNTCNSCLAKSDRYDQRCVVFDGRVVESGNIWWDAFFIRSYLLCAESGEMIRVFSHGAVPRENSNLVVVGTFRQFYYGAYFQWLGIVELKHSGIEIEEAIEQEEVEMPLLDDEEVPSIIDT